MKKNILLIFVFALLFNYGKGQLTFNPRIEASQDTSVKAIAQLWENYESSVREAQPDSIQRLFWHNQSDDLIEYWLSPSRSLYAMYEHVTFSIRKYSDTIYEIHTLLLFPPASNFDVLFMYKVCAVEIDGIFKLVNYFDVYKHSLQCYNTENVEFYYPHGFHFDIEKADYTEKFIRQFRNDYNIKKTNEKILCVIGNHLNESNAFMGFDFSVATSESKYAGGFFRPRTIITRRPDHIHEFVHAIMKPEYPNAHSILHEGIATYYGGTVGLDYAFYRNNLKEYINDNPVDFLDDSLLWDIYVAEKAPLSYIVGALIIEYTLKNYGNNKVLELFSCEEYEDIFSKLGIKMEDVNTFFTQLIDEKHE